MSDVTRFEVGGQTIATGNLPVGDLPKGYIYESIKAIRESANVVMFELGVTTNNRDFDHVGERLATVVSSGEDLAVRLPWFEGYYHGQLQELASEAIGEEAICLSSLNEILVGLAFGPGMRIEAHTDVWAINANLFLKSAKKLTDSASANMGGTIIGHKNAKSHSEILANPIAVVASKVGTLSVLSCNVYPHTIGVADSPAIFKYPDITTDAFWKDPQTRVSLNVSYTTKKQLAEEPILRPMTDEVGYSRPVLGSSLSRVLAN